jgi:hypothetical protein
MTTIAIIPENHAAPDTSYRAISGRRHSVGKTAGEALDALTSQLGQEEKGTLIVVQHMNPDTWFNAEQRRRLEELMTQWRSARERQESLPPEEQEELDALVAAELQAASNRAAKLVRDLSP